jgi:hypothetical protein
MLIRTPAVVLVALLATGAAPASGPAEAFACNLPYEGAMQSLAGLKTTEQKSGKSFLTFTPMTTVTFDPAAVWLFGATPNGLSVEVTEPSARDPKSKMRAEFIALLPRTEAIDDAITNANTWHLNICKHRTFCIRASEPGGGGTLELHRASNQLKLVCRYELTQEELERL